MIWVGEYHAGQLGRYDPKTDQWQEWPLPGPGAQTYAVYVDDQDVLWASDFGTGTIVRFDPGGEEFTTVDLPDGAGSARQLLGRPSEIWGLRSSNYSTPVRNYAGPARL